MNRLLFAALLFPASLLAPFAALAEEDVPEYKLVLENHKFTPAEITIPADKKVRFLIENHDDTVDEFDSRDLNREKVVMGKSKGTVYIGPLKPGRYKFQGEFHAATAQGVVIVK
jgi:plastocyanin